MVAGPDREHAIATLKVAFVQGRLTKADPQLMKFGS